MHVIEIHTTLRKKKLNEGYFFPIVCMCGVNFRYT